MNYKILDKINQIDYLKSYFTLQKNIKWLQSKSGKQAGVQYAINEDPFLSATGKLKNNTDEKIYSTLNILFQGTIFEDIIKKHGLYRSRLMWAYPKTCYSLHKDKTKRIHIPLITNDNCKFLFPGTVELVHLPVGYSYIVDTTKVHSFCNFSEKSRLHFIGCIDD